MITFFKWKRALRPFRFPLKGTLHWREYISPHLEQINRPMGCKLLPIYGAIRHFNKVNILKEYLLNTILNIGFQIYFLYLKNFIHSHQSKINLILHKNIGGSNQIPDALSLLYLMLYL